MKTLQTQRLILRPFTFDDASNVQRLCDDYDVCKTLAYLPYPYTIECAKKWIARHEDNFNNDILYEYAVTNKETGELIGCISLSNNKEQRSGEIGYWIGKRYWGNGYCTEAAKELIAFAFSDKDFHRIFARHFSINPASGRVMQKCGMRKEGEQKQSYQKDGKYFDEILYAILKNEWSETNA